MKKKVTEKEINNVIDIITNSPPMLDPKTYKGLTLNEATEKAKNENGYLRVARVNGKGRCMDCAARLDRVNVSIKNDVVIHAWIG